MDISVGARYLEGTQHSHEQKMEPRHRTRHCDLPDIRFAGHRRRSLDRSSLPVLLPVFGEFAASFPNRTIGSCSLITRSRMRLQPFISLGALRSWCPQQWNITRVTRSNA